MSTAISSLRFSPERAEISWVPWNLRRQAGEHYDAAGQGDGGATASDTPSPLMSTARAACASRAPVAPPVLAATARAPPKPQGDHDQAAHDPHRLFQLVNWWHQVSPSAAPLRALTASRPSENSNAVMQ